MKKEIQNEVDVIFFVKHEVNKRVRNEYFSSTTHFFIKVFLSISAWRLSSVKVLVGKSI